MRFHSLLALAAIPLLLLTLLTPIYAAPPTLDFSTYLGGGVPIDTGYYLGKDTATGVALDSGGNVYVTGTVGSRYGRLSPGDRSSGDFPYTSRIGPRAWIDVEVFLTKFSPTGELLASVLIGGRYYDEAHDLALDSSGNIYITGWTGSTDFPHLNAYQEPYPEPSLTNYSEAFILKLDPNFNLLYSSVLGGSSGDAGYGIFADDAGMVYVTGGTYSTDFPVKGALMTDPDGSLEDGWVAKFDTTLSGEASLIYSTYLDGVGDGRGNKITADSNGNGYVMVTTKAPDFPLRNEYAGSPGGCFAVAVAKLNPTGSEILYSTYLGRTFTTGSGDIAVNDDGHVYVTGTTSWDLFPTRHAYQDIANGDDVFLTRLNTNLAGDASLIYSTFLGGTGVEEGYSLAVNPAGKVHLTGKTNAGDFPVREFRPPGLSGSDDIFLAQVDTALTGDASLVWSTWFGGSGEDVGKAVASREPGGLTIAGVTLSPDLPVTPSGFQTTHANVSSYDAFVMKYSQPAEVILPLPDIPSITYFPLMYFSVVRPLFNQCQPVGSAAISGDTLYLQVGTPGFKPGANLYLALYGSDLPISSNTGNNQDLDFSTMYFLDGQGNAGPAMVPWQYARNEPLSQLLTIDITGLKLVGRYCNLALFAQVGTTQQSGSKDRVDLQQGYYGWITQITLNPFPWPVFLPALTQKNK